MITYRFTNSDQSIDVQYLTDSFDGHNKFVITEKRGIDEAEIIFGFQFKSGVDYWIHEFAQFAIDKELNLDAYDNNEYLGRIVEGGVLEPCLENLSYWSDTVDVDNKLFTAQVGTDVPIENTNVIYFDGTSNGVATVTHEAITTVTDIEVYFSADNVTWSNTGAYNIVDDTLTIGYNGSSYVAGYYSIVTVIKNTNPILQFTLAENNITENINRLDESVLDTLPPGGQLDLTFTLNFNRLAL